MTDWTVESTGEAFDSDEKRFYMPGTVLKGECPSCQEPYVQDLRQDYLSYPPVNTPFSKNCYCGKCEHEWKVTLRVTISLSLVSGAETK